jgi:asparagine synthetase B (glutamine-hydrolysing)
MPGISGLSALAAHHKRLLEKLAEMEAELYPGVGLRREASTGDRGFACSLLARRDTSGVLERHGACLAFDGYVVDVAPRGRELLGWLLDGFLARGPAFLEGLNGSFQIAVHHQGTTWLFADPTGSRRLFYTVGETAGESALFFSPEVPPLTRVGTEAAAAIDPANLVHFLLSGRFFAGQTLLPPVRQLLPGESLCWRDGRLEHRRAFHYEVSDPEADRPKADRPELLAELGDLLERAILRAWAQADAPVIALTGGYDSRYIFHAITRKADDPGRLESMLWGQRLEDPETDCMHGAEIARRAGIPHFTLPWRTETLPEQFEEMFRAQSGMTEMIFTHSDDLAVFRALHERGFRSMLRGDECFGPKGEEVDCVQAALSRVSMSRTADVPASRRWLIGDAAGWLAAHDEALDALVAAAPAGPSELRDTLYGRERLPALLHHHNYYKLHFLEMVNPLLDADVLRFWSALPRRHRLDKSLLKESYHARFGDHLEVPIAQRDNGADWVTGLRGSPALAAWVRERLATLPEPLDRGHFLGQLDAVLRGGPEPPAPPAAHRIPAVRQVARAIVLGRWLR